MPTERTCRTTSSEVSTARANERCDVLTLRLTSANAAASCTAATFPTPGTFAATICCHVASTSFAVLPKWLISRWERSIALDPLRPVRIRIAKRPASEISRSGTAERMNASRGLASSGRSLIFNVPATGPLAYANPQLTNQHDPQRQDATRYFFLARAGLTGVDFTSSTILAVTSGCSRR